MIHARELPLAVSCQHAKAELASRYRRQTMAAEAMVVVVDGDERLPRSVVQRVDHIGSDAAIDRAGIEFLDYDKRWRNYRLKLSAADVSKNADVLRSLLHQAYELRN